MDAIEAVAIVILILAILVLIYYYLQNSPGTVQKIRRYVPASADAHMNSFLKTDEDDFEYEEPEKMEKEENDSMSKKIKVRLSDIDMSSFNTEAFSKKFDAFLDEKSEELIKDWALATKDDLSVLEEKFEKTTSSVDSLETQFKKFKKSSKKFQKETESKLEEIDKRIEALEEK